MIFLTFFIISFTDKMLVKVKQGWLSGETIENVLGDMKYYSFKGIPYARPPTGSLRFKAPKPPLSWKGVRNAKEHGSTCPYMDILTKIYHPGSEDCLFLNVYSPNINADYLLPVIFFIHGGGYKSFSGNVDYFGPDYLVRKGVVVVTINYRLDALGFLCLNTKEVPGNAGLKDQLAALKWVKSNINKFGGNPNMVTIFGESAGGSSVTYHVLSPASKGYFHRAIALSGSAFNDWTIPYQPVRRAFVLGQILGHETRNKTDLFNFLQNIPYEKLVFQQPTILASEKMSNFLLKRNPFSPVYEKDCGQKAFIPADPNTLLNKGVVNDVDFMIGYTNEEGLITIEQLEAFLSARYERYRELLVPFKIVTKATPDTIFHLSDKIHQYFFGSRSINNGTMKEMVNYVSNSTFVYDIHRFIRRLPNPGKKARYLFKLSFVSKREYYGAAGARYNITGTSHMDSFLYLFDAKALNLTLQKGTLEYKLVDLATTLVTNFAKFGNPTPDTSLKFRWPQYDNVTQSYAEIGNTPRASTAPDQVHVRFWEEIFNYAGIQF